MTEMPRATRETTRLLAILAIVVSTIGCDRVTKHMVAERLAGWPPVSFAADSVRLEYTENPGGFLSLGAELPEHVRTGLFSLCTSLVLVWLGVWVWRQVVAGRWVVGPALLWAGGVANLVDRVARGSVIDFLNVGVGQVRTGIFNVADVAIMLGAAIFVLVELRRGRGRPYP